MSINIPSDLIRNVQNQIRQQSPFSSLNPNDPSLPSLPSFQDVIADFDSSLPSYLRCKRCKGSFLSGLQSLFCVYCGAECRDPELPPDSIKFNSTIAYRWLLDSLKLDGSEIVGKGQAESEPNRNLASPKKEVTLSELLDLEIRWPERPKKVVDVPAGDQFSSKVSLVGVNVEDFFPSSKNVSAVPNDGNDSIAAQDHGDVDLFANAASMEIGTHYNPDGRSDDFSEWATQFQGSTSVNSQNEELSFDSFKVSSDLSAKTDTVFAAEKVEKTIISSKDPSLSNSDWNEDDMWSNFNSGVTEQSEKLEARKHEAQDVAMKLDISSDQNDEWGLGGKWQTSSEPPSSESESTKIDLFGSNDLQHDNLGDFGQPALFSSSLENISTGMNQLRSEANVSDRVIDFNFKTEEFNAEKKSIDDVETLMSQMHDLSFMLENNLVIPKATTDS